MSDGDGGVLGRDGGELCNSVNVLQVPELNTSCYCSVAKLCPPLCTSGSSALHCLPEFAHIHVY